MSNNLPTPEDELEQQVKQMFASAWQDGVNHLNPEYLRRDTLFTERVMWLIHARERRLCLEAQLRILRKLFQGYKRPLKASNAETLLRTIEDKLARLDAELQKGDV